MKALTFGAFDLLHYGHMRLLGRIAAMADHLVVGLATDDLLVATGKPPFYSYAIRREMLLACRHVDAVEPHGGTLDGTGRVRVVAAKIALVAELGIDVVVMGDDWRGDYGFLEPHCRVAYLERTPDISTSMIRRVLASAS
jgi:glycerol-3-phosphate cytidylyltransferase